MSSKVRRFCKQIIRTLSMMVCNNWEHWKKVWCHSLCGKLTLCSSYWSDQDAESLLVADVLFCTQPCFLMYVLKKHSKGLFIWISHQESQRGVTSVSHHAIPFFPSWLTSQARTRMSLWSRCTTAMGMSTEPLTCCWRVAQTLWVLALCEGLALWVPVSGEISATLG